MTKNEVPLPKGLRLHPDLLARIAALVRSDQPESASRLAAAEVLKAYAARRKFIETTGTKGGGGDPQFERELPVPWEEPQRVREQERGQGYGW